MSETGGKRLLDADPNAPPVGGGIPRHELEASTIAIHPPDVPLNDSHLRYAQRDGFAADELAL